MTLRTRNLFDPASTEPYRLSRSKVELFLSCPRCFSLDRKFGVGRPDGPAFSLNLAVDTLLKKEFDIHRAEKRKHPLMETYGVDAIPYKHPELAEWRDPFRGIEVLHAETNFLFYGAVDDVWVTPQGELIVVDYKATSTDREISLEGKWQAANKRQLEMYQWLLRAKGYRVSKTGYFVYVNALKDREAFDAKLEFSVQLLAHAGDASWVGDALREARLCLERTQLPPTAEECEWCAYRRDAQATEGGLAQ
ncbi:MAG: PD-(D/E)XK nuclease family protein [Candidatus Peregrinibacteria bacterium]|nr:PD-(D/E)XK nuclease family protein [Candidatus Peregrinibacteria bacterium]